MFKSLSRGTVIVTIILALFTSLLLISCRQDVTGTQQETIKGNVQVTVIDKIGNPITNVEVIVQGVNDRELANTYILSESNQFIIKNLGERNLDFIIHTEEKSYYTHYTVTKSDIEKGEITVQFSDYE